MRDRCASSTLFPEQLFARDGDRLIFVRHPHGAQRKERLKRVELLIAERDREPRRPRVADDLSVGLPTVAGQSNAALETRCA